jgi:hypothetical protein
MAVCECSLTYDGGGRVIVIWQGYSITRSLIKKTITTIPYGMIDYGQDELRAGIGTTRMDTGADCGCCGVSAECGKSVGEGHSYSRRC